MTTRRNKRSTLSRLRAFSPQLLMLLLIVASIFMVSPEHLYAQQDPAATATDPAQPVTVEQILQEPFDAFGRPSLISQAAALTFLALLPFIIMLLTSFVKIVVVLSLLRNALGVQQAPPNQVINGIAFLLSLYIMYPTAVLMYDAGSKAVQQMDMPESLVAQESPTYLLKLIDASKEPLRGFLMRNSSNKHQRSFYRLTYKLLPVDHRANLKINDFLILVPSYITSQLKDAFEIGVLIYIPFFVIDLVTSNILLAMGMMMLSPVTISMPLKLFLLVMLDGWSLLVEGLVTTFK